MSSISPSCHRLPHYEQPHPDLHRQADGEEELTEGGGVHSVQSNRLPFFDFAVLDDANLIDRIDKYRPLVLG